MFELLFLLLIVLIVLATASILIRLFGVQLPRTKVEKTPHGFTTDKVMVFAGEEDNEPFKEGLVNGKQGVFFKHDWGKDAPTFYARPNLDYVFVGEENGKRVFVSRKDKEGFEQIPQSRWNGMFGLDGVEQLSEEWFEKQREDNVHKGDKELVQREISKIVSDSMDEEFASQKTEFYKNLVNLMYGMGRGRRGRGFGGLGLLGGEESEEGSQ